MSNRNKFLKTSKNKPNPNSDNKYFKKDHVCKTPDAIFETSFKSNQIGVNVKLPFEINMSEDEMKKMEADLHYAVEAILAPLFNKTSDKG